MSGRGKSVGGGIGFGIGAARKIVNEKQRSFFQNAKKVNLLHPVLGFPVNPSIHWQLQTWLKGVPKALGPQGSRMHGSAQVKLLSSQYLVVWQ